MATIVLTYALLSYCLYNNYALFVISFAIKHENDYTHTHIFFTIYIYSNKEKLCQRR